MCRSWIDAACLVGLLLLGSSGPARAGQLGSLVSPGALARAHAALEGGANCQKCHEAGRKVTPTRCLTCHQPIASRMASRKGVHRNAVECVSCHVEHAGVDAELRHIDTRTFAHAAETGFALDGLHAKTAANCVACHKTHSYLDARPACSSCHADVHKGALGIDCTRCHSTQAPFKQARAGFDHTKARFALTGTHREVACVKCHKTAVFRDMEVFRGRELGACVACHEEPHRKRFGAACTSCHTTATWDTRTVEHAKTRFPLVGAHAQVACVKCHRGEPLTKPMRFDQCSACHVNVHRESVKDDCRACHTETTFKGAAFNHATRAGFPLEGKHLGLACVKCHTSVSASAVPLARKVLDYRGAERACIACHADRDPHKGEFGRTCDACHRPATFSVKAFTHPRAPDFYGGQHERVACQKCHLPQTPAGPVGSKPPGMECVSCHADVHLGQLGMACERCHAVGGVKFAAVNFSHVQSRFPLTGKHQSLDCATCHRTESRAFPSRTGTAVAFNPVAMNCRSCHKDPHLGQLDVRCETCHQTTSFAVSSYTHTGMDDFFSGFHGKYACKDCHKREARTFPAGQGSAVWFKVGRTCASCHRAF